MDLCGRLEELVGRGDEILLKDNDISWFHLVGVHLSLFVFLDSVG